MVFPKSPPLFVFLWMVAFVGVVSSETYFDSYDMLQDLTQIFSSRIEREAWIREGKDLQAASRIFLYTTPRGSFVPEALGDWVENPGNSQIQGELLRADREVRYWDQRENHYMREMLGRTMVDELLDKAGKTKPYQLELAASTFHESNVYQLPDDNQLVSDRSAGAYDGSLKLQRTWREQPFGQFSAAFKMLAARYQGTDFKDRDHQDVTISVKDRIDLGRDPLLHYLMPQLDYRVDYLRIKGNLVRSFQTVSLRLDGMTTPRKSTSRFSDLHVSLFSFALEKRMYVEDQKLDANAQDKGSLTSSSTLVYISMKEWSWYRDRWTWLENFRNQSSDSGAYHYRSYRLGAFYQIAIKRWPLSITPEVAYSGREYPSFFGLNRGDSVLEAACLLEWKVQNRKSLVFDLSLRHQSQDSDIPTYEFTNDKISAGVSSTF
ncbi:MAG: hypothetical protein HQL31_11310 [Planctomycetes bacterium]|nr:hypothetical protein [Planctomycetota bacterium]